MYSRQKDVVFYEDVSEQSRMARMRETSCNSVTKPHVTSRQNKVPSAPAQHLHNVSFPFHVTLNPHLWNIKLRSRFDKEISKNLCQLGSRPKELPDVFMVFEPVR